MALYDWLFCTCCANYWCTLTSWHFLHFFCTNWLVLLLFVSFDLFVVVFYIFLKLPFRYFFNFNGYFFKIHNILKKSIFVKLKKIWSCSECLKSRLSWWQQSGSNVSVTNTCYGTIPVSGMVVWDLQHSWFDYSDYCDGAILQNAPCRVFDIYKTKCQCVD